MIEIPKAAIRHITQTRNDPGGWNSWSTPSCIERDVVRVEIEALPSETGELMRWNPFQLSSSYCHVFIQPDVMSLDQMRWERFRLDMKIRYAEELGAFDGFAG